MITEVLSKIQARLKAPKNQYNAFGKYKYRSLEDVLEGLKPLLVEHQAAVTIKDDIVQIGNRIYVKAIVTLHVGAESVSVSAFARESEARKGMDDAQITGSASSYARKYACNGLFAIDDTKDADHGGEPEKAKSEPKKAKSEYVDPGLISDMVNDINNVNELAEHYKTRKEGINKASNRNEINNIYATRKKELEDAPQ